MIIKILLAVLFVIILLMWFYYKSTMRTYIILKSAGKMQTGNDLQEQIDDTTKNEDMPNFFQFYYEMLK